MRPADGDGERSSAKQARGAQAHRCLCTPGSRPRCAASAPSRASLREQTSVSVSGRRLRRGRQAAAPRSSPALGTAAATFPVPVHTKQRTPPASTRVVSAAAADAGSRVARVAQHLLSCTPGTAAHPPVATRRQCADASTAAQSRAFTPLYMAAAAAAKTAVPITAVCMSKPGTALSGGGTPRRLHDRRALGCRRAQGQAAAAGAAAAAAGGIAQAHTSAAAGFGAHTAVRRSRQRTEGRGSQRQVIVRPRAVRTKNSSSSAASE